MREQCHKILTTLSTSSGERNAFWVNVLFDMSVKKTTLLPSNQLILGSPV